MVFRGPPRAAPEWGFLTRHEGRAHASLRTVPGQFRPSPRAFRAHWNDHRISPSGGQRIRRHGCLPGRGHSGLIEHRTRNTPWVEIRRRIESPPPLGASAGAGDESGPLGLRPVRQAGPVAAVHATLGTSSGLVSGVPVTPTTEPEPARLIHQYFQMGGSGGPAGRRQLLVSPLPQQSAGEECLARSRGT